MNPLQLLSKLGQSPWYDYIVTDMITSGELRRLVDEEGLRGVTTNPSIFASAIRTGAYGDFFRSNVGIFNSPHALYERLAVADVGAAADVLYPVYQASNGTDGFVSIEVDPRLAYHGDQTVDEAIRLWRSVDKPNAMIKVPGTEEGLVAIRELIARGLNVNVTLLFGVTEYVQVAEAFMEGLEARLKAGASISTISSVASFFVSRIDTLVDQKLAEIAASGNTDPTTRGLATGLAGKVAIANAKIAYGRYQELVNSDRWQRLAAAGAQVQRLLWASTSTKNPKYRDTLYVDALIGSQTVNTIPPATWKAFLDHGTVSRTLEVDLDVAYDTMIQLARCGINFDDVTQQLVRDGVRLFVEAHETLLVDVETAMKQPA